MPKIVDHEGYRSELLDQAMEVFARDGYHGVSMRTIAAELGVTTGVLYHYFANKKELFRALVIRSSSQDEERLVSIGSQAMSRRERVHAFSRFFAENEIPHRRHLLLLADFARDIGDDLYAADPELQAAGMRQVRGAATVLQCDAYRAAGVLSFVNGVILSRFVACDRSAFPNLSGAIERLLPTDLKP